MNEKLKKDDREKKVNATLYRSFIGNFLYITARMSDIMFAANMLARFMSNPRCIHFRVVKQVLRYVQRAFSHCIYQV